MSPMSALKTLVPEGLRRRLREAEVILSLAHLHGPKAVAPQPNEAVVTCLVKNGQFYVDQFIHHYLALGFKHICFLDNGSTDETVKRASAHERVTIFRSSLHVSGRQGLFKRMLAEKFVPKGWCLEVDIDEFFDYPYSDAVSLPQFLEYLNGHQYTAVLTQMLDMFSDRPLSALAQRENEDLGAVHRFYDLSGVTRVDYEQDPLTKAHGNRNQVSSTETALFWGGIRKTIYGIKCLLTKHSLFRTNAGIQLFPHVHYVNGASLADVSGVLLHYKFASNAMEEAAQNKSAYLANSDGYQRIIDIIQQRPDLRIRTERAREFRRASDLLAEGFLFASPVYRARAQVS
jgi:hypothetical protein